MWDVVVIGGGGAALCAALSAAEANSHVLVLSKSKLGLGNCTAVSHGAFSLGVGGFDPDKHREKTRETGRWINERKLVEILTAEGPDAVLGLEAYGARFKITPGLASVVPYAAREMVAGTAFTLPLVQAIQNNPNIEVREQALVTDILADAHGALGVEYLDLVTGTETQIAAQATVVATGGAGQLYARTDNPVRTTGDGYALLYNLGLELKDMEFVQFFPLSFADEELPGCLIPIALIDKVPLTNSQGKEFIKEKLPEWGLESGAGAGRYARDRSARAVAKEIAAGRGAFLHLNLLPEEAWESGIVADLARIARPRIDLRHEPVAVAPTQHFFCGGVITGTEGQTKIPGIFACGEVTAGIHGANRVGGNALTELVVFGLRAGKAAAAHAREAKRRSKELPVGSISSRRNKWDQSQVQSPREFKQQLQKLSTQYLGVLRTASGLKLALEKLQELGTTMENFSARDPKAFQEAVEAENLYLTALMVANSALRREESRGVHYREDFPTEDNHNWRRSIIILKGENGSPWLKEGPPLN